MIPSWAQTLLDSPLVSARVKAGIASAAVFAGGWVLSHMLDWLYAHATFFTHATDLTIAGTLAACVAALVASLVGVIYPQKDVSNVDAKVKTAAVTGNVACANNPEVVQQVKDAAGSPQALADLQAKLQLGKV